MISETPTAYLTLSDVPSSSQELHRSSYMVRSAPVFRPYAHSHGHSATFARTFGCIYAFLDHLRHIRPCQTFRQALHDLRNTYSISDLVRCSQKLHRSSYMVRSAPVFRPYAHSHGHSAAFMRSWNTYGISEIRTYKIKTRGKTEQAKGKY